MSVSTWGNTRLRVALVLDNTGSMASDGKMSALKTASHNLLRGLTDGLNTQNRWSSTESDIDAREAMTCYNIKQASVELYTI
jgi:hypothetical protein